MPAARLNMPNLRYVPARRRYAHNPSGRASVRNFAPTRRRGHPSSMSEGCGGNWRQGSARPPYNRPPAGRPRAPCAPPPCRDGLNPGIGAGRQNGASRRCIEPSGLRPGGSYLGPNLHRALGLSGSLLLPREHARRQFAGSDCAAAKIAEFSTRSASAERGRLDLNSGACASAVSEWGHKARPRSRPLRAASRPPVSKESGARPNPGSSARYPDWRRLARRFHPNQHRLMTFCGCAPPRASLWTRMEMPSPCAA